MKEGSEGARLAPEWRRWVVENLLSGADAPDLVEVLVGAGVDAAVAHEAVEAELDDPCFEGTRKALALNRKLEGLLDLYGVLYRQAEGHARVDRRESLSREEFFDRYYFQNRPVVMRWPVVAPASMADWTPEQLMPWLEDVGGDSLDMPLDEDLPSLRQLRESLRPPPACMEEVARPGTAMMALAKEGFQHEAEPCTRNILLCQVHGRRRLQLMPAFELRRMSGTPEERAAVPRLEVELGPGELVLVPVGWWYAYQVLETSISVSLWAFAAPEPQVTWEREPGPPEPTPPPWRKHG
jgi:hypothetical protein